MIQVNNSTYVLQSQLQPYIKAMLGASGLSEFDALTSILFAINTHLDLDEYPILTYLGPAGSGKTSATEQLYPMCKGAKRIQGKTIAAQKRELVNVRTAFIEEADRIDTDLFTCRYSKQSGTISANETKGGAIWELKEYNIFGATVLHRRVPIADVGLRSRSIVIRTKFKPGNYQITPIGDVSMIANEIKQSGAFSYNRVWQTWSPLIMVGAHLQLNDWLNQATETINKEIKNLRGGQGYEPGDFQALSILSAKDKPNHERSDRTVKISEIVKLVKDEFALDLTHNQVREEAEANGFEYTRIHGGYPAIEIRKDLLDKLLPL